MVEEMTLRATPEQAADQAWLRREAERRFGDKANALRITRKSIDARQRNVMVNLTVKVALGDTREIPVDALPYNPAPLSPDAERVVIVGSGPAGLFAALKCLSLNLRPVILERGQDVDGRRLTLAALNRTGAVDPDSNYSFGEGGAGTFSDGKLYTRSTKRGNVREVLSLFYCFGAGEDVLVDAHPHIGSDVLPGIIRSMREFIIARGGEVRFNTRVTDLLVKDGRMEGVVTEAGERVEARNVILATGHSARDIYNLLHDKGIAIEPKGIAVGTRVEHPQKLIDRLQYHSREGRGAFLPPAEYSLSAQVDGRGVYSFCMCPGGVIVPAATGPDQIVVNGMSASGRSSRWANSGMVVEIHPGDFPEYTGDLQMMHLQEDLERRFYEDTAAYAAEHPGEEVNPLNAPTQRLTDFVAGRPSAKLPFSSYAPGIHPARFDALLPPFIAERLRKGYLLFDRRRKGFVTPEAALVGLESRTSSPVRIPRDPATLRHIQVEGLYPVGEGAGYAGGIVSAALDGIRAAETICATNLAV